MLLGIALVHGLGIGILYHYFEAPGTDMATYQPWQHAGHFLFGDDMLLFAWSCMTWLAATLNIRNFHQIVRQQELDASKLNQRLAELRLQTLRMQIDPHFLFNAMNAVAVLIKKGENERAEQTLGRLSSFFRHTLESSDRHWVTLEEELELVRQYIGIVQVIATSVAQRTREIGLGIAVGASASGVLRMVLSQGFKLVGIGIAAGVALALGVAGALGCLGPALRATRINPIAALRAD